MRLLIANDTYRPDVNGSSYFTQRLAEGLVARGHDVHVVCPAQDRAAATRVVAGVVEHRVPSLRVPGQRGFRAVAPWSARRRAGEVMTRVRPDVAHLQGHLVLGRAVMGAATRAVVPVVATNHFMPDNLVFYLGLPAPAERAVTRAAWRDLARVYSRARVVTAPTPVAAALVERAGVPGPVLPVSCGMDLGRFRPDVDGTGFRARHGLPADAVVIGHVGRLDAEKHVDDLVRVLPLLSASPRARVLVVGRGHEEERLRALADRLGVADRVVFAGFVPDAELPAAYAAMDVFCALGTAELQCLAALEAMATGLPLVAARVHALPHLVEPRGGNGSLVPPGDLTALAAALTPLLRDAGARHAAGRVSRSLVSRHDLDITLDAFEELYDTVAPGRRGPVRAARSPRTIASAVTPVT